jgi:hypothetical protein
MAVFQADSCTLPFPFADIRKELEKRMTQAEISFTGEGRTAIDRVPACSSPCGRRAELLNHGHIGIERLLLGLLRESNSTGAEILRGCGRQPLWILVPKMATPSRSAAVWRRVVNDGQDPIALH